MLQWVRNNPRWLGRILILSGIAFAGFLSKYGYLPQPEGTWRAYSVQSIERVTVPNHGHPERTYRLKSDFTTIDVDESSARFFDHAMMNDLPKPVSVEVLADHEADNKGEIRAQGIRLVDGKVIMDPVAVHEAKRPQEIFGVVICSLIVISGIALQLFRKRKPAPRRRA